MSGRPQLQSNQSTIDAAYAHIEANRPDAALALTAPLAAAPKPSHDALVAHAHALKALGRVTEAFDFDRRAIQMYPQSPVAWHNFGAAACDLERTQEARHALERALSMGLDRPETLLAYARTLGLQGDLANSERAYRMALQREPGHALAATELARLLWTASADVDVATAPLTEALMQGADEETIVATLVKIYEIAGRRAELRILFDRLIARWPDHPDYFRAAAEARLVDGDVEEALRLVDRSLALDPSQVSTHVQSAAVRLGAGRADEALAAARRAVELAPENQATWGWLAAAARAAGSPEYAQLFDYDAFVRSYLIDTPETWDTLDTFLEDLRGVLRHMHRTRADPVSQSVRGGTQTPGDLSKVDHPVLRAFWQALERPITKYLRAIGQGDHPFTSRNNGRYRIQAAWSVRLRNQGHHANHFHPRGWISSAFYVDLPPSSPDSREGWIQFGEPPFLATPPQPPARFVEPKPGMLVLFPSYMWHGTVPFSADAERLTIAFDAVPD